MGLFTSLTVSINSSHRNGSTPIQSRLLQIDFLLGWATFEDAVATSSEKHRYFFIRFLIDAAQVCAVFQLKAMNGLPEHFTAPPLCYVHSLSCSLFPCPSIGCR